MKSILLTLTVLFIGFSSSSQSISNSEYKFTKLKSQGDDVRIEIYHNDKRYDEIDLLKISNNKLFHYQVVSNDDWSKVYFSNFLEVFEYDVQKKKVKKILPLDTDSPRTTYSIMLVLEHTLVLKRGYVLGIDKLMHYHKRKKNGTTKNDMFIFTFYNTDDYKVEKERRFLSSEYNNGVYVTPTNDDYIKN